MGFKKSLFYRLFLGILTAFFVLTPVNVYATEDAENQAAYNKTIESNEWDSWPTGPSIYAESASPMKRSWIRSSSSISLE